MNPRIITGLKSLSVKEFSDMMYYALILIGLGIGCLICIARMPNASKKPSRKSVEIIKFYHYMEYLGYTEDQIAVMLHDHKSLEELIRVNKKLSRVLK